MANYICRINIYLPLKDDLRPDTPKTGHFDIQIMKSDLKLFGKTYSNPHISYGQKGVTITNGSEFALPNNCLLCYLPIAVTDADIASLKTKWLDIYCAQAGANDVYDVTNGPFKDYSTERYNCFGAAAEWCNLMGYSKLKNIYDKYTDGGSGYKNYIAWPMFKKYHMAWTFAELKV